MARGLSRGEQGKDDLASRDFAYAGKLFTDQGDSIKANQLEEASQLVYNSKTQGGASSGNGYLRATQWCTFNSTSIAPIALRH